MWIYVTISFARRAKYRTVLETPDVLLITLQTSLISFEINFYQSKYRDDQHLSYVSIKF